MKLKLRYPLLSILALVAASGVASGQGKPPLAEAIEPYFDALQRSEETFPFVIIGIKGSEDFIQFAQGASTVVLDFPLWTERQREQLGRLQAACENLQLNSIVSNNADGSRSLNCLIPGTAQQVAQTVVQILTRVFDINDPENLDIVTGGLIEPPPVD